MIENRKLRSIRKCFDTDSSAIQFTNTNRTQTVELKKTELMWFVQRPLATTIFTFSRPVRKGIVIVYSTLA